MKNLAFDVSEYQYRFAKYATGRVKKNQKNHVVENGITSPQFTLVSRNIPLK